MILSPTIYRWSRWKISGIPTKYCDSKLNLPSLLSKSHSVKIHILRDQFFYILRGITTFTIAMQWNWETDIFQVFETYTESCFTMISCGGKHPDVAFRSHQIFKLCSHAKISPRGWQRALLYFFNKFINYWTH